VGAVVTASRRFVKQGGTLAEAMIRREVLRFIGERIDYAVLSGRGSADNEPDGLCNRADVPEVDGTGTAWADVVGLTQSLVGQHSAVRFENLRAVGGPGAYGLLAQRARGGADAFIWEGDTIGKTRAAFTQTCVDDALVFGDFSQAAVLVHGGIELIVDPRVNMGSKYQFTVLADIALHVPQPRAFKRLVGIT
jgi:Phage capsid family